MHIPYCANISQLVLPPGVGQSALVPGDGVVVVLGEEVVEDRLEVGEDLPEHSQLLPVRLAVDTTRLQLAASVTRLHILQKKQLV